MICVMTFIARKIVKLKGYCNKSIINIVVLFSIYRNDLNQAGRHARISWLYIRVSGDYISCSLYWMKTHHAPLDGSSGGRRLRRQATNTKPTPRIIYVFNNGKIVEETSYLSVLFWKQEYIWSVSNSLIVSFFCHRFFVSAIFMCTVSRAQPTIFNFENYLTLFICQLFWRCFVLILSCDWCLA